MRLSRLLSLVCLYLGVSAASAQAQAPGTGVSHVQWSGAPVACLPNRAQRWDDNNPQQPCHCPPKDFCPPVPDLTPENIDFYVTYTRVEDGGGTGSGTLNGSQVTALADGSVTVEQVLSYSDGTQLKNLLYEDILRVLHIDTKYGTWTTNIEIEFNGLANMDDWINDTLKLPTLLASRCCQSACPPQLQPTVIPKQVLKPKDPDEGILMSLDDLKALMDDLRDVKSDVSAASGLAAQATATDNLITKLKDYTDAPDPTKFGGLNTVLKAFNTKIKDSAVPAKIATDHSDAIAKADALATQVASEIHYLNNPQYITVKTFSCTKVLSYPREGCLITGTQITMADGSKKAIEDLTLDDVVKGNEGPAKIIAMSKFTQREEFMYSINGGKAFFTVEHPVLTPKGWKSVDATITSIKSGIQIIGSLKVGDTILLEGGKQLKVSSIDKVTVPGGVSAYNLSVERDGSFIANGFIMKGFKKMQMHY